MAKITKNQKEALEKFERLHDYSFDEAIELVKSISFTKFDASFDVDVRLGRRHQIS